MVKMLLKSKPPASSNGKTPRLSQLGPTWDVARLFPDQGSWTESDYLELDTNQLVELSNGKLEFLAMPTRSHQFIVAFLYAALSRFVTSRGLGKAIFAPYRVRLWKGVFREPDIIFVAAAHARNLGERFSKGADLVMEVVSEDEKSRRRDLVTKRREYAQARIGEYWIVDPVEQQVTVLKLRGLRYVVSGKFGPDDRARSAMLKGFEIDVAAIFAAAR
jgi:Uma2 family endonuclease